MSIGSITLCKKIIQTHINIYPAAVCCTPELIRCFVSFHAFFVSCVRYAIRSVAQGRQRRASSSTFALNRKVSPLVLEDQI
jgi:hypothetical protein